MALLNLASLDLDFGANYPSMFDVSRSVIDLGGYPRLRHMPLPRPHVQCPPEMNWRNWLAAAPESNIGYTLKYSMLNL